MKKIYIKRCIVLLLGVFFVFSTLAPIIYGFQFSIEINDVSNQQSRGDILYVGGSGPGNYSSIQGAVNAAQDGDTIFVYSDVYNENVVIDKTITLVGENKDTTVIDGGLTGDCIKITADSVIVNSFTIKKGLIGVNIVQSSGQEIKNNIIRNNWEGIGLYQVSDTNFTWNSVSDNYFEGINPIQSLGNTFSGNKINWNLYGILLTNSNDNFIYENEIKGNTRGIEAVDSSNNNKIYHNNFYASEENNAYDDFSNIWDDDYPSGGNYWDDYTGSDNDGDGIGDTPYAIPGDGNNEDRYPLMEPYIIQNPPNSPYNPYPSDGATGVDVNASLSWNCSDPDGDNLTYDVFFEADDPIPDILVSNNQSESYYDPPGQMQYNTIYYWQIIAWDSYGASTPGPIWYFTTSSEYNNPPDTPTIDGPNSGKPGTSYDFTFNAVDPDGDDVRYIIDWGDTNSNTTIFAASGTNVTVSHTWGTVGQYTITAKAEDTNGLIGPEATYIVTMPRSKAIQTSPFLNFLQSYPNLFKLMQMLLQRLGLQ